MPIRPMWMWFLPKTQKVTLADLMILPRTAISLQDLSRYNRDYAVETDYADAVIRLAFSSKASQHLDLLTQLERRGGWVGDCAWATQRYIIKGGGELVRLIERKKLGELKRLALLRILSDKKDIRSLYLFCRLLSYPSQRVSRFIIGEVYYSYRKELSKLDGENREYIIVGLLKAAKEPGWSYGAKSDGVLAVEMLGDIALKTDRSIIDYLESIKKKKRKWWQIMETGWSWDWLGEAAAESLKKIYAKQVRNKSRYLSEQV